QALVDQKIQRAIYGGRGRARLDGADQIQQFIGLDAAVLAQQDLEYLAAYGGQPLAALRAQRFGSLQLGRQGGRLCRMFGGHGYGSRSRKQGLAKKMGQRSSMT